MHYRQQFSIPEILFPNQQQQNYPGYGGGGYGGEYGGGGYENQIVRLERQVQRLNRRVNRLNRRLERVERQLGYQ
ncbi:hypothetical protein [Bacillus sp. 2205SS5-2]|uniref:hypothetical protein n=1 Tax=Bacillus sp. 2205SS5-2 TaxID=3109031 RepID=UPI003005E420